MFALKKFFNKITNNSTAADYMLINYN